MSKQRHKALEATHAAVRHLQAHPPGTELMTANLAEACGRTVESIRHVLTPGIRAGLLRRRIEPSTGFSMWSLGPNAGAPEEASAVEPKAVMQVIAAPSVFAYAAQRGAAAFSVAVATDGRLTTERNGRVIAEYTDSERRILIEAGAAGVVPPSTKGSAS